MKVKVKYQQSTVLESTIDVDDAEFIEWYVRTADIDDPVIDSIDDIDASELDDLVQEFLEDGDFSVWATGDYDPHAEVFDQEITRVAVD